MLHLKGKLVFNPNRKNFRKTHKTNTLILEFEKTELDLFYQKLLKYKYGNSYIIQRPMFGIHCTIIKGNEPFNGDVEQYINKEITVLYDPENIHKHWKFWVVPVISDELNEIRKKFHLPKTDLHITIGREY